MSRYFFPEFHDQCLQALTYLHDNFTSFGENTALAATASTGATNELDQWRDVMMGRYQIDMSDDGKLGEGAFCECRMGRVVETGELVAIKVYKPQKVGKSDDTRLKKFARSISVLKKLQAPFERPADAKLWTPELEHVKPSKLFMRLVDYSQDADGEPCFDSDGKLYLVTELAQQSLKDFMANRREQDAPPSKETVRGIAKSVVLVMAGLHAKGLVHLDVKPENLMVFDGCLKLIDVDGCVEIGSQIASGDSSISFSPVYCAPEWAGFVLERKDGSISASPGLDTWSVGCTICELVTMDAILKPWYFRFLQRNRRTGSAKFMEWLTKLEDPPVPRSIKAFDADLDQFVTGCLMVCDKTQRRSCAESLDCPYLAADKVQRTKSSPIKVQAYDDVN